MVTTFCFLYVSTDGGTVLIGGPQQQFLFLETIVEETSDDLRSESDRSGPAGWADSDSDTESVIHVPNNQGMCDFDIQLGAVMAG